MSRNILLVVVFVCAALIFSACGEKAEKTETSEPAKKTEAKIDEGVVVGKEILATFDKAVTETGELAKEKPAAADLKPKIEALFKTYEEKMTELNKKYLALKQKDIAMFGSCNGYLGENRGKHVFKMNEAMYEYVNHYTSQEGGAEIVQLISKDIINLLEVAVKR